MRQIAAPSPKMEKLFGQQKIKPDCEYRLTKFHMAVPCADGTLLYHTMTGEMLLLEAGETPETLRNKLLPRWFFVPADFDENKQVRDARALLRLMQKKPEYKTSFAILPTTDCNARCAYCFENGIRRFPMTRETAHATAAYIAKACGGKPVKITWFGGEPLYNREAIDLICEDLRGQGVAFSSMMVSNGYYLDAETAAAAVRDWHLEKVQIPLDGTREVYNRTKAYIDRDGDPFERVMGNIGHALDAGIRVSLVLEMEKKNAEDLFALFDALEQRFGGRKGLTVNVAMLREVTGRITRFATEQEAADTVMAMIRRVEANGWREYSPLPCGIKSSWCQADSEQGEAIMPDGSVCPCMHYNEDEAVGTIFDSAKDEAKIRTWKECQDFPACGGCAFYPLCINLKKCDRKKEGCSEVTRTEITHSIERQMLDAYESSKRKQQEEEA